MQDPNAQFETLDALGRAFSSDVLFLFMDLTAEAEALGARVAFSEDQPPSVVEHSPLLEEDLRRGRLLDPERDDLGQGIHSNFILSTGCDLPPEVLLENITAFVEGGRESIFGVKSRKSIPDVG